jgi:predicted Zn-dependent protease
MAKKLRASFSYLVAILLYSLSHPIDCSITLFFCKYLYQNGQTAIQESTGSVGAKTIEPGKYTVILEPTAAAVLLENIFFKMDACSADEGSSLLSKPGGKTKLSEK